MVALALGEWEREGHVSQKGKTMRGMSRTIVVMFGLLGACGAPGTYSSLAIEDGLVPRVRVIRVPTAEQLAMVSVLAEMVVEAEQISYRMQDSSQLAERLQREGHLLNLVEELERRHRDLEQSGALRSEISRISLQTDVVIPLEELQFTLRDTRRQEPDFPSPY